MGTAPAPPPSPQFPARARPIQFLFFFYFIFFNFCAATCADPLCGNATCQVARPWAQPMCNATPAGPPCFVSHASGELTACYAHDSIRAPSRCMQVQLACTTERMHACRQYQAPFFGGRSMHAHNSMQPTTQMLSSSVHLQDGCKEPPRGVQLVIADEEALVAVHHVQDQPLVSIRQVPLAARTPSRITRMLQVILQLTAKKG